ncbi:class I SAM-dependent methyltransferase [Brevibacillus daliensis]|uniref:class I SAM-dependent methyltransferase n=1 Tax=Brevibacillus daliensis TaxID=2892995 RepID=UPI001E38C272|nr:methyltransferase [Brevibacillus daliensis]
MSDFILFLRRFVSSPGQVGSVIPSSRYLSKLMMKQVNWNKTNRIAELGPGTGVFTKAILSHKHQEAQFLVVERDAQFRQMLQERFPELTIRYEAQKLPQYLDELCIDKLDAIISGLPFAVFPDLLRSQILDSVIESLHENGTFITFQYSLQMKSELESRFSEVDIHFTPFNIPPAFVYVCRKG